MKNNQYKIKPFSSYKTSLVLESFGSTSPRVAAFSPARTGIKRAARKLRSLVLGVISKDDCIEMVRDLRDLQAEAEYALVSAITIIAHSTEELEDYADYQAFSNICLPMRSTKPATITWNDRVKDAVAKHYSCMSVLKEEVKSAPTYRKKGHDYCEDMLEMGVRVAMRPGIVRFTRGLEKTLGWASVEQSGVLSHIKIAPVLSKKRRIQ